MSRVVASEATRKANQITSIIPKSKVLENNGDVDQVIVNWGFDEVQLLRNLGIRDVPSPILGRYQWPGMFTPFDHLLNFDVNLFYFAAWCTCVVRPDCLASV